MAETTNKRSWKLKKKRAIKNKMSDHLEDYQKLDLIKIRKITRMSFSKVAEAIGVSRRSLYCALRPQTTIHNDTYLKLLAFIEQKLIERKEKGEFYGFFKKNS